MVSSAQFGSPKREKDLHIYEENRLIFVGVVGVLSLSASQRAAARPSEGDPHFLTR
jgi:hypothetical protein